MTVRVVFVRHGSRHRHAGDPRLTDIGRAEAERAADALVAGGGPVAAVYSSPLARAHETALIIGKRFGLPAQVDPLLRERANWDDGEFEAFDAVWRRASVDRDWQPPFGDSARAAGARLSRFMDQSLVRHVGATVVAATHGGVVSDFLRNEMAEGDLRPLCAGYDEVYGPDLRECSFTICEFDGRSLDVRCVGEAGHLLDLERSSA